MQDNITATPSNTSDVGGIAGLSLSKRSPMFSNELVRVVNDDES